MKLTDEQQDFLVILEKQLGITNAALSKADISIDTYNGWLNNLDFKNAVAQVNDRTIDYVENQLLKKITDGDLQAITFYLKTKGKKRGY